MPEILNYLFGAATFVPHGYCLLWRPDLVALHAISDGLIAAAYIAIPVAMLTFLRKRPDIDGTPRKIAYLFVAFILACAVTHVTALVTLWIPAYGAQGLLKALTAVISIATAIVVWQLLPKLLEMPSLKILETANDLLTAKNIELNTQVGRTMQELDLINDRFEKALTGSNITVFSQDSDLRYTWIHNPRFGFSSEDILGKLDQDVLPKGSAEEVTQLKRQVMETAESASTYLAVDSDEAGTVFFDLIVHPTKNQNGTVDGVLCTAIDITEKNLYEIRLSSLAAQLGQANKRFENALDGSLITVFEQDRDLKYVHIINPPPGTEEEYFIGKTDADIFGAEDQLKLVPVKQQVIESGESRSLEVDVGLDGTEKTYNVRLDPARNAEGDVVGVLGTAVDLTYKRESERQMHLVMRELTHRSKNLLAVIQAMARQTAARSDNPETFVETFSARLQAMAASHDLLVSQSWYGADLKELVRAHLAQSIDPTSAQVEIDGAPLSISADAAQNLGLALHELTTNAAKYGALSVLDGKLKVSWRVESGQVTFNWAEAGGPTVTPPERNGFGRLLLEQLVGPSLDGTVSIDFRAEGVRCQIAFPAAQLVS